MMVSRGVHSGGGAVPQEQVQSDAARRHVGHGATAEAKQEQSDAT